MGKVKVGEFWGKNSFLRVVWFDGSQQGRKPRTPFLVNVTAEGSFKWLARTWGWPVSFLYSVCLICRGGTSQAPWYQVTHACHSST